MQVRNTIWNLKLLFQGQALQNLNRLQQWQYLSQQDVQLLQRRKLSLLLKHAFEHVPHYREVLADFPFNISGDINISDFEKIPFMDKAVIRDKYEQLQSDDLGKRKWFRNTSGGSTGEPVRFVQDKEYADFKQAVKILFDHWANFSVGEGKVLLWGSERDLLVGRETLQVEIGKWLRRELWLNAFCMAPEQMYNYTQQINSFKPKLILAYVESIYELSRFIEQEGIKVHSPRAIMTSAGTLQPHMRDTIERVFETEIFNRYGSREVGDIACECERHQGLHVSPCTHYVEIIDSDGRTISTEKVGEVVVTSLTNYAMPLIRYRIGDRASWSELSCPCGRNWPLLKTVGGRITDSFLRRDGQIIDGRIFNTFVWDQPFVKRYQFIQEDYEKIRVLIVPVENAVDILYEKHHSELVNIRNKVQSIMGAECYVKIEFVDNISPSASGKYRYTWSKVTEES